MNRFLATALVLCATAASARELVVPVITGTVPGRIFSTTVQVKNPAAADVQCRFLYAGPERIGNPLRSDETIPAGKTKVYEDFLSEIAAAGTVRVTCSGEVEIVTRVQDSIDGGQTFSDGRVYRPFAIANLIARGEERTVRTSVDLVLAEMSGKPVHVEVVAKNFGGVPYGKKSYDIPAHAQRVVNLATVRDKLSEMDVTITVTTGEGKILVGKESRDPALAKVARHRTAAQRAVQLASTTAATNSGPSITEQLLICPFKAAPFREPATGLCFMRDRWYDPSTGTFLTPDRAGYRDSSNLYIFGKGDPVNNSDPTGMTVALSGSSAEKRAAYNRLIRTIDNPAAARNISIDRFNRLQITGMTTDEYLLAYGGRAQQLGRMINSSKTVFVSELLGELEHPIPGAKWPFPASLEDKVDISGGGFFDPDFYGPRRGLALFDARKFPRNVADVTETADAVFVHEFFGHAYSWAVPAAYTDATAGTINPKYVKRCDLCAGIGEGEAEGLAAENRYRLDHGLRLRTYYLAGEDDYIPPSWLAPYIAQQKRNDAAQRALDAERQRRQRFLHNIWEAPGKR